MENSEEIDDINDVVNTLYAGTARDPSFGEVSKPDSWWKEDTTPLQRAERALKEQIRRRTTTSEVYPIPQFLIDKNLAEERMAHINELREMLKHGYSLYVIADILETNDYENIESANALREDIFKEVGSLSKNIKIFTGFKKFAGSEQSNLYAGQEKMMGAALESLYTGLYFTNDENFHGESRIEFRVRDIIAKVIDTTEFKKACKIETEYLAYELERVRLIIEGLDERAELEELVGKIIKFEQIIARRTNGVKAIKSLIETTGRDENGGGTPSGEGR